jgi:predicted enzyme related to lactoylglutathione lyase
VANDIRHFAINADDLARARRFYERVFGWKFEPGIQGALQGRRELVPGKRMIGYECSIAVDDVDQVAAAVRASGGRVLMERTTIVGVGHLIFFEDPEGNVAGAMQYDSQAE